MNAVRNDLGDRQFGGDRLEPENVRKVLALPAFEGVGPDSFPERNSLEDLIADEGRISTFQAGEIILRKGDYGSSLFVILSGEVLGLSDVEADRFVRALKVGRGSLLKALRGLFSRKTPAEYRSVRSTGNTESVQNQRRKDQGQKARSRQYDLDVLEGKFSSFRLRAPEMFGELAALTRSPRSAHVFAAADDTQVFELSWQGLREIRIWSEVFRNRIDGLYSERGMATTLRECDLFRDMDEQTLELITNEALFETYGNFNWTHRFQKEAGKSKDGREIIDQEQLICGEGQHVDGLLVVNSGFARVSEKVDNGERTIGYLSRNDYFGLEAIQARQDSVPVHTKSLRAIGYVDVIRVPTFLVEKFVLPQTAARRNPQQPAPAVPEPQLQQGMMDFLVDQRFINGEQAMVINLDRCVGCDDCVRACASTHGNNPRFNREGPVYENAMIASACMHCTDPVCLIGCPTGAIHRTAATGAVIIDDDVCIGCSTCANACPYNNIVMVEVRTSDGVFQTDANQKKIARATKCDLCADQLTGPACAHACPHDALARVNIRDTAALVKALS